MEIVTFFIHGILLRGPLKALKRIFKVNLGASLVVGTRFSSRFPVFSPKFLPKHSQTPPQHPQTPPQTPPERARYFFNLISGLSNFRVFRGGIREVFGGVLTCFSSSFLSISRANFRSNRVPTTKEAPKLTLKILLRAL